MQLVPYLLGGLVILGSGFLQGVVGFGYSLLSIPFLSLLINVKIAIAMLGINSLANNLALIGRRPAGRYGLRLGRPFWVILLTGLLGTVAGVRLLVALDTTVILSCVGGILLLYVLMRLLTQDRGPAEPTQVEDQTPVPVALGVGLMTGLLTGLAGLNGPALVPYVHSLRLSSPAFVAYLNLLFLIFGVYQLITYIGTGLYTWERVGQGLALIPVSLAGVRLGVGVRQRITAANQAFFNRLVLGVLFLTGLSLLARGLHLF